VRLGANQDDQRRGQQRLAGACDGVFDIDPFQPLRPVQAADHAVVADLDVRAAGDAVDQVARHAVSQVGAADDKGDGMPLAGEPDRRLAGRVATADDCHGVTAVDRVVNPSGGVEHTEPAEPAEPGGVDSAVGDPGSNDHAASGETIAGVQVDHPGGAVARQPGRGRGQDDRGAEPQHLDVGLLGELLPADPDREAQIVFDPGGGTDLTADGHGIHQRGGQAF
jgi:hypothetical protein